MTETHRFVILTHDHPVLHWDLMIEAGDALRTWRLEQRPQPGVEVTAIALPDHRLMYLDYEGPVSGGRGTVARWDAGTCTSYHESPEQVTAVLHGERINGTISLTRSEADDNWLFVLQPPESRPSTLAD